MTSTVLSGVDQSAAASFYVETDPMVTRVGRLDVVNTYHSRLNRNFSLGLLLGSFCVETGVTSRREKYRQHLVFVLSVYCARLEELVSTSKLRQGCRVRSASTLCPPSITVRSNVSIDISRFRQIPKETAYAKRRFFALYTEFFFCVWPVGPDGMNGRSERRGDANPDNLGV